MFSRALAPLFALLLLFSVHAAAASAPAPAQEANCTCPAPTAGNTTDSVLASGTAAAAMAKFAADHPVPPPDGKPYNICLPYAALPYVYCHNFNADGTVADPSGVLGFEADMVNQLLSKGYLANWTYGTDYQFLCVGAKSALKDDLLSPEPRCLVAAGGLDITLQRLQWGIKFSLYPTDRSGVVVLTTAQVETGGMWFFLKPFSWQVWLSWGLLCLVMIAIMYAAETSTADPKNRFTHGWRGFCDSALNSAFLTFNRKSPNLSEIISTPARVMVIFAAFVFMIFVQIYTAQLAGLLAAKNIKSKVHSVDGLRSGQFQYAYPGDLNEFVVAAGLKGGQVLRNWSNLDYSSAYEWLMDTRGVGQPPDFLEPMFSQYNMPRTYIPDALLLHYSEAQLAALQYCNLYIAADEPFQMATQALAFPSSTADSTVLAFGLAQAALQEAESFFDGASYRVSAELMAVRNVPVCSSKSGSASKTTQVTFEQIEGLLIVLGIGVCITLLLMAWAYRRPKNRAWQREHYHEMRTSAQLPQWRTLTMRQARAAKGSGAEVGNGRGKDALDESMADSTGKV